MPFKGTGGITERRAAYTIGKRQILFLHGYLSSSKSFYNQLDFFGRDFEVFAPDLKGFGDNAGMSYPYSLNDYVSEVKEYMYSNSIEQPAVVAHSFGARVAIKAQSGDGLFDRLVLCGAAGLKPKFSLKKCARRAAFKMLSPFVPKSRLKGLYSSDYLSLDQIMRKSFNLIVNEHLDGLLENINRPTLLVFGDKDGQTPLYMARKFNRGIRGSRLIVLKGAGHFCFIDMPHTFNREVKEFLLS